MTQVWKSLSCHMFVRKKKNRSGSITVVVVDKCHGKFKEVHNLGTVRSESAAEALCIEGRNWIASCGGRQSSLALFPEERLVSQNEIFKSITQIKQDGAYRLLSTIYNRIGFSVIPDKVLKDLAIARVCEPQSKLATIDYMRRYWSEDYHYQKIYRYLDNLYNTQKEQVLKISVDHTRKILGGTISVVFYDVTTLYFESFREDALRSPGFSKDGKTAETQVVLGLLVSRDGYPLAYSLFNGSQFEGRTMLPIVDDFIQRYGIKDFVLVADSGLISKKNIALLKSAGYKYIIGARIRSELKSLREWALAFKKEDGTIGERKKANGDRLIINYTDKRAAKDEFNRNRGVKRLQKAYQSGKITKDKINKRGYNKFLNISKDITVEIDMEKVADDARWDGWKGYITNTDIDAKECISQYHGLWVIERSFRISKGTLDMRPMFHFTERRIEAHVCLCFVALKVYKELERILRLFKFEYSVDKTLEIAKTISTVTLKLPNEERITQTLYLTTEQQKLTSLFDLLGI